MIDPGCGEAWTCARCQRLVLGEGSWGISPSALCTCGDARQPVRPLPPSAVSSTGTAPNAAGSRPPSSPIDHGEALAEALRKTLNAIDGLMDESRGVEGLHLNGDIALWSELTTGGFYEAWLEDLDVGRAALSAYTKAKGESR